MPSYPLSFPALNPARVEVYRQGATALHRSPFSFKEQVYDWGGRVLRIVIRMQTMDATDAATWGAFLRDLDGQAGTFTFNCTPWCPGWSPAPGSLTFRAVAADPGWSSDYGVTWDATLEAIQVL